MAIEAFKTSDLAGLDAVPEVKAHSVNRSKLRFHHFWLPATTIVGDAGTTIDLLRLPAGAVRMFVDQSRIFWTAFGAARLLDIGHRAYEDINGQIVAAAPSLFDNDIDVSVAGNAALGSDFSPPAGHLLESNRFLSAKGVMLFATVAGGTIPVGTILEGYVVYTEI